MAPEFGRYTVIDEVGRGAMGVVYKGEDPLIGRTVAIKAFNRAFLASMDVNAEEFLERFRREAQVTGGMNHPHIVKVFDLGPDYIVMEYVEGQTLAQVIKTEGALPLERALTLIGDTADALDYAHKQGVVHRDIKPGNVMVEAGDVVKIMDFGLARIATSNLTAAGAVLGSASYMAPEVIQGRPADAASDIFSLGVLAYEVMTGVRPFSGKSVSIIITKIVREQPRAAAEVNLPSAYDPIFQKVLAKEAADRYASAREFSEALQVGLGLKAEPAADVGEASMVVVDMDELGFGDMAPSIASAPEADNSDATHMMPIRSEKVAKAREAGPPEDADSTHLMPSGDAAGGDPEATSLLPDSSGISARATGSGSRSSASRPAPPPAPSPEPEFEPLRPKPKDSAADSHFTIRDKDELRRFRESLKQGPPPELAGAASTAEGGARKGLWIAAAVLAIVGLIVTGLALGRGGGAGASGSGEVPQPGELVALGDDVTAPQKIAGGPAAVPEGATGLALPASVLLEFVVNDRGSVEDVVIVESGGEVLDGAAMLAVMGWRYAPAEKQGVKVRVKQRARFRFE